MSNYWADRFIEEEERLNKIAGDEIRRQQLEYERAISHINKDIEKWYNRIAVNNNVSLADAKKLLSRAEREEFKWTVEEYIKHGSDMSLNILYRKELENASSRYHIERLEAMKLEVRGQIEKLYNSRESGFENHLKNVYRDQYNRTAFQIAKGTGVGTNLYRLNDKLVDSVIKKPWAPDGKNFSERIWADKNRLINILHTEMTQAFIRGDSLKKLTDKIAEKMNVSKANASRLVYTESAAYGSKARQQSFNDLDVEKFEVVATLDNRTSEICQDLDGKVFDVKDYDVGVTAPPYHVRCRSTTAPYFEDDEGERIARGEDGKTYYVPSDITYKEWKEKFLENNDDTVLKKVGNDSKIKDDNSKLSQSEKEILDGIIADSPEEIRRVWEKYESDLKLLGFVEDADVKGPGYYSNRGGFYVTKSELLGNGTWLKPFEMYFHEAGHQLDPVINLKVLKGYDRYYISDVWQSMKYKGMMLNDMLIKEFDEYLNSIRKKDDTYISMDDAFNLIKEKYGQRNIGDIKEISDIFSGITKDDFNLGIGHRKEYWNTVPVSIEAFAEFTSASIVNPGSLELIKEVFPKSYEIYLEILDYAME